MTLSLLCCHMPGISQSVSNTSLTPPLQCLSLSLPFSRAFPLEKRNGLPKMNGDWNPPSFTYPSVRPSIIPKSFLLLFLSLLFCQITHRRSFIPSKRRRPDARYVLRAENSLSQIKHERNTTLLLPKRRHRSPGHVNT